MEVDCIHAQIERVVKNKNIYSPSSYVTLIKGAKRSKPYYKVKYVDHTYFDDYSCFGLYHSIRQGRVSGDPKVVDLVQLKYEMTSSINRIMALMIHGVCSLII